jgi:MFS family permease
VTDDKPMFDGRVARLARRLGVQKLVIASCVLGLAASAMMCWSVLDPTPFPVLVAMSVGQAVGGLSLFCYVAAVLIEAVRTRSRPLRETQP